MKIQQDRNTFKKCLVMSLAMGLVVNPLYPQALMVLFTAVAVEKC